MRNDPLSELPEGKDDIARAELARFLESYRRHLAKVNEICLTILIWGQNPSAGTRVAEKRRQIRDELRKAGHNAMFSEELQGILGKGLTEKTKELAQLKSAHFVICLMEGSPGAHAEVHDFCNHLEVAHKFFIMIPISYKDGYSAKGALASFGRVYRGRLYWYKPEELTSCRVLAQAMKQVQSIREFIYCSKVRDT